MTHYPQSSFHRASQLRGTPSINDIPLLSVDRNNDRYSVLSAERYSPPPTAEYNSSFRSGRHGRHDSLDDPLLPNNGIRLERAHFDLNVVLFIATILSCGLTSYYAYNATLKKPNQLIIPRDPNQTVGILNAMSTISIFLLGELVQAVFERTRWILASRTKGIALTEFLGMSRATSTTGVFSLFFWNKSKPSSGNIGSSGGNSKVWIFQRYYLPFKIKKTAY